MSEEKKYVLFTPVGGNDPIGNEYDKDYMIEEINKKLDNVSIDENEKKELEKLKEYIESQEKEDHVIIEGPILHIVRHYKPKCVLLLFTQGDKDIDSKFRMLKREIRELSSNCIIRRITHINADYAINWKEGIYNFNDKIQKLLNGFEDHEILVNITSASPQISFKLCNEIINNNKLKGIQVSVSLKELQTQGKKDKRYIDNNIKYINKKYENNISRCIEPKIYSVIKPKLKSQIESLISSNGNLYNYQALYRLLDSSRLASDELFGNELFENVNKANDRINLKYEHKDDASDFIEYYFAMKVKQIKGELSDFFLRITPFVTELFYYYLNKNNILSCYFNENNKVKYININKIIKDGQNINDLIELINKFDSKYFSKINDFANKHNYNNLFSKNKKHIDKNKLISNIKNTNIIDSQFQQIFNFLNNFKLYECCKKDDFLNEKVDELVCLIKNKDYKKIFSSNIFDELENKYAGNSNVKKLFDIFNVKKYKLYFCSSSIVYITMYRLNLLLQIYKVRIDNDIYNLLKKIMIIEDIFRQDIAHKLISINEKDISLIYIKDILRRSLNLIKNKNVVYTKDILNSFINLINMLSSNSELFDKCNDILVLIQNNGKIFDGYVSEKCNQLLKVLKSDIDITNIEMVTDECKNLVILIMNNSKKKLLVQCKDILSLIEYGSDSLSSKNILLDCERLLYLIFHKECPNYFDSQGNVIFAYDSINEYILKLINRS